MSNFLICLSITIWFVIFKSQALPTPKKIKVFDQKHNRFQGDIANIPRHPLKTRNGIKFDYQKWTNGIIPFVNGVAANRQSLVQQAMNEIQARSCLKFVRRTTERNYINIRTTRDGCYSSVGMAGGPQDLSLQDDASGTCMAFDIVIHELLHAVGLYHEQSRYDRDNYVVINRQNIQTDAFDQFDIVGSGDSSFYNTNYDYRSVMHYDAYSFSKNRQPTITTKDPAFMTIIGNVKTASDVDMIKINRIYNCQTTGGGVQTPQPPVNCLDIAHTSFCSTYRFFCSDQSVGQNCRKTCKRC